MERGNTKHGSLQDEELAHETEPLLRGAPQRAHTEEWREVEPLDGADPVYDRPQDNLESDRGSVRVPPA